MNFAFIWTVLTGQLQLVFHKIDPDIPIHVNKSSSTNKMKSSGNTNANIQRNCFLNPNKCLPNLYYTKLKNCLFLAETKDERKRSRQRLWYFSAHLQKTTFLTYNIFNWIASRESISNDPVLDKNFGPWILQRSAFQVNPETT